MSKRIDKEELMEKIYQLENSTSSREKKKLKNLKRQLQRLENGKVVAALSAAR